MDIMYRYIGHIAVLPIETWLEGSGNNTKVTPQSLCIRNGGRGT